MSSFTLETPHGLTSITDTALKNSKPVLLLLHGSSSSSKIWRHMFASTTLTSTYRVVAFDLPGHGASSKAPDPAKSYIMSGYADLAVRILQHLNITHVVVLGWSLGGHVAIELIPLLDQLPNISLCGIMITGTPPALGVAQINAGFRFENPHLGVAAKVAWTAEEAESFARTSAAAGKEDLYEDWMLVDATHTDGRARMLMWKRFADADGEGNGVGADQRRVVETVDVLVAVVNGADEPYVNLEYLEEVKWRNLWRRKCGRMEGLQHAPFWEAPALYEGLLRDFLRDCETGC